MAFTKINAAGIGSTETVTLDGLTVINDGSFGGNVSVGGTLTYEDVTNIDSVGLITARAGVVVGSGITLSKDGDVFFTGIATGNGSGLTALNASNISSGTVPTARLGSGTASSSTFLRGDSTFQTVNTDLVSDTSPQLGGDLDTNDFEILLDDNHKIKFGAGSDLTIESDGTNGLIKNHVGGSIFIRANSNLQLMTNASDGGADDAVKCVNNGAVELYYDNSKKFETSSTGNQGTGVLKLISGGGSTSSDDDILHIVSGGTSNRGIKIGTGRATGSSQNDGMGYIDAIDSESSGYGAQIQLRVNAARVMNVGYQANKFVGINEDDPGYELVVAAQDTNESTLQILAGGDGKESNILFGAPDDADVGKISYDHNGDHMKFITGTTERFRVNSNGICLGGTGSANGLDDYEEGTWTPTIRSGGGSITHTYNAIYTKVGRLVHVQTYLQFSDSGTTGNAFQMDGLPFTIASNNYSAQVVDFGRGGKKGAYSRTHTNNTFLEFLYSSEATGSDRITIKGNQVGSGYIILSCTYQAS